jgi:hypothetical protein
MLPSESGSLPRALLQCEAAILMSGGGSILASRGGSILASAEEGLFPNENDDSQRA